MVKRCKTVGETVRPWDRRPFSAVETWRRPCGAHCEIAWISWPMRSDEDSVRSIGSLANLVTASGRCRASGHKFRQRDGVKSCEVDHSWSVGSWRSGSKGYCRYCWTEHTELVGGLWQVCRPFFCRVRVSPTEDPRLLSTAGSHLRRIKLTLNWLHKLC